jgi:hypothetical protein
MPEFKSSFGEKNQLPRDNRPGNPATFGRVIGRALPPSETRCLPIETVRSLDADTLNALSDHLTVCLASEDRRVRGEREGDGRAMVKKALGGGVR